MAVGADLTLILSELSLVSVKDTWTFDASFVGGVCAPVVLLSLLNAEHPVPAVTTGILGINLFTHDGRGWQLPECEAMASSRVAGTALLVLYIVFLLYSVFACTRMETS